MSTTRRKAAQAERGMSKAKPGPHHALVLLTAEHNEIDKLVQEFARRQKSADKVQKGKLALRVCHALARNACVKKQVFYPAAEAVLTGKARNLLGKLRIEQDELTHLVARVENEPADSADFDAAVLALGEHSARHGRREEEELFPHLRHSGLDLLGTGERMAALQAEFATAPVRPSQIRRARKVMARR
jgi:hypothetical protein